MGERANVLLYQKRDLTHVVNHSGGDLYNYSPVIYTHWGGYEMKNVVKEVAQYYTNDTSDTQWEPNMRVEVERVFPKLVVACIKNGLEPQVFNFDMLKFKHELPKGNDMPIIADDWGTLLVNIDTWSHEKLDYDWSDVNV